MNKIVLGTEEPFGILLNHLSDLLFLSLEEQPPRKDLKTTLEVSVKISSEAIAATRPVYVISSLFLYDCYKSLVKQKPRAGEIERMGYVTGVKTDNKCVLTKILQPEFAHQSGVRVCAEDNSSHQIFLMLEDYGHGLYGWFHNHPGTGEYATFPSHIDHETQERLNRGGYLAIGGIFSRDGFVRFFGVKNAAIIVSGKGVKRINEYLFKLDKAEEM